jgi:hypothetical protein
LVSVNQARFLGCEISASTDRSTPESKSLDSNQSIINYVTKDIKTNFTVPLGNNGSFPISTIAAFNTSVPAVIGMICTQRNKIRPVVEGKLIQTRYLTCSAT